MCLRILRSSAAAQSSPYHSPDHHCLCPIGTWIASVSYSYSVREHFGLVEKFEMEATEPHRLNVVTSVEDFMEHWNSKERHVAFFTAPWARVADSTKSLLQDYSNIAKALEFIEVDAEGLPEASKLCEVQFVPTVVFFHERKVEERLEGINTKKLVEMVQTFNQKMTLDGNFGLKENDKKNLGTQTPSPKDRLIALVNKHRIMVFMKGTPEQPRCGFSRTLIEILKETGEEFCTFDILEDEDVRQGLKNLFNWQTYPQVYVNGELVGGLDIIKELKQSDELVPTLKGN